MTQIHLTFWREKHEKSACGTYTSLVFKPFSDRIAGFTLIDAKNEAELKAEVARHLDQIKPHLAALAAEEYGAEAYVKPSLSADKRLPGNRKFAKFDQIAREVCKSFCFNASQYLAELKAA